MFLVVPEQGERLIVIALWDASDRVDIDRYQRVADDLLGFLASASGTTDEVVPELLAILARSLDFDFATAWRWEPQTELLHCDHVWRRRPDRYGAMVEVSTGLTVRSGEGLAGLVVRSDEPVWTTQLTRTPHLKRHDAIVADGVQTAFVFPIRTRGRLVGVIELFSGVARLPDRPLVDAVATVCAELGEFIERLELEGQRNDLLEELERAQRRQAFLLGANRALVEAHDFAETLFRLADVAVPTLGDICLIDVLTTDGTLERLAARHVDPARQALVDQLGRHTPDIGGGHPAAKAVRTGTSQWSTDMGEDFMRETTHGTRHLELTRTLGFRSYLSVPLQADGVVIGALTMVVTGADRPVGSAELSLAEELAGQVAAVVQRARLLDEQSTIARHLQASLLPTDLHGIGGLSVSARYLPSTLGTQVGGDFYDVVPIDDDRVALVIGDVEGHDMAAATIMGQLRSALRAYLLLDQDPGQVLALLDRYLGRQPQERLATALVAVLDLTSGKLALASAGHPGPYLSGPDGSALLFAPSPGPPLGVGGGRHPVRECVLEPTTRVWSSTPTGSSTRVAQRPRLGGRGWSSCWRPRSAPTASRSPSGSSARGRRPAHRPTTSPCSWSNGPVPPPPRAPPAPATPKAPPAPPPPKAPPAPPPPKAPPAPPPPKG